MTRPPRLLFALLASLGLWSSAADAQIKARTEDGRDVILNKDGTWAYVDKSKTTDKPKPGEKPGSPQQFKKSPESEVQYKGKHGTFSLSLIPGSWKQPAREQFSNPMSEMEFRHKDGDLYGIVLAERVKVPVETLKKLSFEKLRMVDPDAKVILDEKRIVNGKEVNALISTAETQGIPITFYAYIYSGPHGSIQCVTWTGQNLFDEMKPEMENFLNGFELIDKKK